MFGIQTGKVKLGNQEIKDSILRIAVITSSYPRYPGDPTAPFVKSICEHLVKLGHDVAVVAPYDPLVDHKETEIVPVKRFRYIWPARFHVMGHARSLEGDLRLRLSAYTMLPFFLIGAFFALFKITAKQKSQAVHAHWVLPNGLVGAFVARLRGIPLIISLHGSDIYVAKGNPFFAAISRWILSQARAVTACSPELKQDAIRLGSPQNTILLPWGADPDLFTPELKTDNLSKHDTGKIIIASAGRLVSKKGFHNLLTAFSMVIQEYPNAQLILSGDGPEREHLELYAVTSGVGANITFTGKVTWYQMPKFLANVEIFVLPSIRDGRGNVDGLPTVLLEAMSSGAAVIASDIGGTSLVISDGENGLLVPPGDVQALAHAILRLITNKEMRVNMGQSARDSVLEKYNWTDIAQRIADLISQSSAN